jgi:hypothetical protein
VTFNNSANLNLAFGSSAATIIMSEILKAVILAILLMQQDDTLNAVMASMTVFNTPSCVSQTVSKRNCWPTGCIRKIINYKWEVLISDFRL